MKILSLLSDLTWRQAGAAFDLRKQEFLYEALEQAGVDTSYLPEVRKGHFLVGETRAGVPVMGSIGDNQASLFGSVRDLKDTVLLNVGTGSQVSLVTEKFIECSGSVELRPCTENSYILVGASLCGGRAYAMLEQFTEKLQKLKKDCIPGCRSRQKNLLKHTEKKLHGK